MYRCDVFLVMVLTLPAIFLPRAVLAQADCRDEIAIIDERLAAGGHPDNSLAMGRMLRDSLAQMCAYLDDGQKKEFVAQIDEILPTGSKDEQNAARRARSAERSKQREARKEAEAARPAPALNAVLQAPPSGRSVAARFVDRVDDMDTLWIWDWDILDGDARILYTTAPSLPQLGRPDWQQYVYVVEIDGDGAATQRLVTSRQAQDHAALALRRGHDELIFQRGPYRHGDEPALERWSVSGKSRISSAEVPSPLLAGGPWDWNPFRLATSDGNVLYSTTKRTRDGVSTVAWFEASPSGDVLGRGEIVRAEEQIGVSAWFHTVNGGAGLVVQVQPIDDTGIKRELSEPIVREIAGRQLWAHVFYEKRLLVTADGAASAWESPAVERGLMWGGDTMVPQDRPYDQVMREMNAQRELTESVDNGMDANRSIDSLDVGPHRVEMIKPIADGYGILSTVTASRDLEPPIHGPYFLELGNDRIRRSVHLEPLAKQINVRFTTFAVSDKDEIYLYGNHQDGEQDYVILLGGDGEPTAYARSTRDFRVVDGMMSAGSGVWLFGHGHPGEGGRTQVWVERIEFP